MKYVFSHGGEKTGFYIQEGPEKSKLREGSFLQVIQQVRGGAETGPQVLPAPRAGLSPHSACHGLIYNMGS